MQSAAASQDKIFYALADPSRRAIFESLTRGESAVKDLTARFDISQPAVSQHLATLKWAGLVNARREGRSVYYRVQPRGIKPKPFQAHAARRREAVGESFETCTGREPGIDPAGPVGQRAGQHGRSPRGADDPLDRRIPDQHPAVGLGHARERRIAGVRSDQRLELVRAIRHERREVL